MQRAFTRRDWMNAGQGWEGREDSIQLAGWQQSRRVVILRRPLKENLIAIQEQQGQLEFAFVNRRQTKVYEYAVLVTVLKESILGIAQMYRGRADAENGFDELSAELRISAEAYGLFARLRSGCWGTSHGTSSCATSSPKLPNHLWLPDGAIPALAGP
ncbi:hypothetical protein [Acidithiobacillus sp.]|uniref:hypothetical protein n=1 Tax=Acidithiobacillus sp. TaxID=1872118 RepID=UPI0025C55340|nr:hypothetical protein [Acidithiobacillus sp.]